MFVPPSFYYLCSLSEHSSTLPVSSGVQSAAVCSPSPLSPVCPASCPDSGPPGSPAPPTPTSPHPTPKISRAIVYWLCGYFISLKNDCHF